MRHPPKFSAMPMTTTIPPLTSAGRIAPPPESLSTAPTEPVSKLDAIRIGINSSPSVLDPLQIPECTAQYASWLLFDTLSSVNQNGQLTSFLAEEVVVSDEITYTFSLRRNVIFADGSELTPQDVVTSWERTKTLEPEVWSNVESVTEGDPPMTVKVVFREAPEDFLTTQVTYLPIVKQVTDHAGGALLVGTGPYKLVDGASPDTVMFERHIGYWGEWPVPPVPVVLRVLPSEDARLSAIAEGTVNLVFDLSDESVARLLSDESVAERLEKKLIIVVECQEVNGKKRKNVIALLEAKESGIANDFLIAYEKGCLIAYEKGCPAGRASYWPTIGPGPGGIYNEQPLKPKGS